MNDENITVLLMLILLLAAIFLTPWILSAAGKNLENAACYFHPRGDFCASLTREGQ